MFWVDSTKNHLILHHHFCPQDWKMVNVIPIRYKSKQTAEYIQGFKLHNMIFFSCQKIMLGEGLLIPFPVHEFQLQLGLDYVQKNFLHILTNCHQFLEVSEK